MNGQKNDYLLGLLQWAYIYISSFSAHNNHVNQGLLAPFYRWWELEPAKTQMTEQREPIADEWHSQEFSFFLFTTLPFPHPNTTPLLPDKNFLLLFMPVYSS